MSDTVACERRKEMTEAEEMVLKTVHDLGVAGDWDVYNYTGLSPVEAGWALDALYRKEYLKIVSTKCECDTNEHGEVINVEVFTLLSLHQKAKKLRRGYLTLTSRCAYR